MKALLKSALAVATLAVAAQAAAQITFYEHEGFRGREFTTDKQVGNFERFGFNDRASSVIVLRDNWEICSDAHFGGRCMVLRPGRYPNLAAMGMNDQVSSVRDVGSDVRVEERRYAPPPVAEYNYQRRGGERLHEATVTSVHAVVGPPEQRCWVEREQVQDRGGPNVGGAIAGAVIGGILGHQIGGGRGRDAATAGGVVAGAAIGSNVGRDGGGTYSQDVQRCRTTQQGRPEFWDVTYDFRGIEHRVQMAAPPGATITVNDQGEPRT